MDSQCFMNGETKARLWRSALQAALIASAPLNRAADMLNDFKGAKAALKTARELRAPYISEVHILGNGNAADCIGSLFKAAGWVVIFEPKQKLPSFCYKKGARRRSIYEPDKKVGKSPRCRMQPRRQGKRKGT